MHLRFAIFLLVTSGVIYGQSPDGQKLLDEETLKKAWKLTPPKSSGTSSLFTLRGSKPKPLSQSEPNSAIALRSAVVSEAHQERFRGKIEFVKKGPTVQARVPVYEDLNVSFDNILFEFDSTKFSGRQTEAQLGTIANAMKGARKVRFLIEGHTDHRGEANYNQSLSEDRSVAVLDHLIQQGVSEDQLVALGYGEKDPVATNETDEGRQLNRRVVIRRIAPVNQSAN